MNFRDFMRLARQYNQLGWAVQSQMDDLLSGEPIDDMNPNALALIRDLVENAAELGVDDDYGLVDCIDEHLRE